MSKSKALAKRKIKEHLTKKGDSVNFEVTPTLVLYWWRELNQAIFDNLLIQPVDVRIKKLQDEWAWCVTKNAFSKKSKIILGFDSEFENKELFITVLAHEMLHQWEQQTYGRMTHGKRFFAWKEKFNKLGLELEKSY